MYIDDRVKWLAYVQNVDVGDCMILASAEQNSPRTSLMNTKHWLTYFLSDTYMWYTLATKIKLPHISSQH